MERDRYNSLKETKYKFLLLFFHFWTQILHLLLHYIYLITLMLARWSIELQCLSVADFNQPHQQSEGTTITSKEEPHLFPYRKALAAKWQPMPIMRKIQNIGYNNQPGQ